MFNKSAVIVAAMALAQLAAAGLNAFIEPTTAQVIEAGKPFEITWKADGGKTVTITLRKGDSKNLDTLEDIARQVENTGKLPWTPAGDLEKGADYALQIKDDETGEINYTGLFSVNSNVEASPDKPKSTTVESTSTTSSSASVPTLITSVVAGKNGTSTTITKPSPTGNNSTTTAKPSPVNESGAESLVRSPIALFLAVAGAALYLQ
ncbi:hypothetical protein BJ508DRAFT_413724 [Ascobolus immersus RN42]|uniref:Yeast cell wall synthesis Kre9/Knh1-like N-terminal domain-containing protein n=1 Tax=Ascobolus immersus RN42 TaxID=1160509 RepID=A0A3N4IC87_ASCIM|nr:hypothetical protein BJ508DRAFT_413724 [Ascobolus immersus RN42]